MQTYYKGVALLPRGHQLPKAKGVWILKSLEFTLISLISKEFTDLKRFYRFHGQKPDHHLIITITKQPALTYIVFYKLPQCDNDIYNQFSCRQLEMLKQK